jgi:uncharacterized protein YdeI (YjbR/CyaY-like superfamily)
VDELMMKKLYLQNAASWRKWLSLNHDKESEIWLVFYKKDSGKSSLMYEESVEEALCFGWIDSIIKNIDQLSYVRKFTPRKEKSAWSPSNKRRVKKLIAEHRMTDIGLAKIQAAKQTGIWDKEQERPQLDFETPEGFISALSENETARMNYEKLAPSQQKPYIIWISMAKREETRNRRIREAIAFLQKGEKLGLK